VHTAAVAYVWEHAQRVCPFLIDEAFLDEEFMNDQMGAFESGISAGFQAPDDEETKQAAMPVEINAVLKARTERLRQ